MRTLQIVNKLNEILYVVKSDKTVYWDRQENIFHILKGSTIIFTSSNLETIYDYILHFLI